MKIDATHVALVPTTVLRIRECTTAELNQAQAKFNVMSHDNQSVARKELSNTKRTAQKNASSGCSTCPTAQAAARAAQAEAEKPIGSNSRICDSNTIQPSCAPIS